MSDIIDDLLARGIVARFHGQGFIPHPIGVTLKKNGKLRLIWDGRFTNNYDVKFPTHLNAWSTFVSAFRHIFTAYSQVFMLKLDLHQGYWQLPVHPDSYGSFGFTWRNENLAWHRIPMGWTNSSYFFCRFTDLVAEELRRQGLRVVIVYIDDFLFLAASPAELAHAKLIALDTFNRLGLALSLDKNEEGLLVTFLGTGANGEQGCMFIPNEKIDACRALLSSWLSTLNADRNHRFLVKQILSLAGKLRSVAHMLCFGPAFCTEFFAATKGLPPNESTTIPDAMVEDLTWWAENIASWPRSRFVTRPNSLTICTWGDASAKGWGFHAFDRERWGIWADDEREESIPWKELNTVLKEVSSIGRDYPHSHIISYTDAQTVHHILAAGRSKIRRLNNLVRQLALTCAEFDIEFESIWIPRENNERADFLSKLAYSF